MSDSDSGSDSDGGFGLSKEVLEEMFNAAAASTASFTDVRAMAANVPHVYLSFAPPKHHVCIGGDVIIMFQLWQRRHGKTLNIQQVEVRPSVLRRGILTRTLDAMEAEFEPDATRIECANTRKIRAFCAARGYKPESDYEWCDSFIKRHAPASPPAKRFRARAPLSLRM